MQRTVIGLRVLWIVLMGILLVLVVTNTIDALAMVLYGIVVLAVAIAEMALKRRVRQP